MTKLLWADAGASGKPGGLWACGMLQCLVAQSGNASPGGKSWKLKRTRFTLGDQVRSSAVVLDDAPDWPLPPVEGAEEAMAEASEVAVPVEVG